MENVERLSRRLSIHGALVYMLEAELTIEGDGDLVGLNGLNLDEGNAEFLGMFESVANQQGGVALAAVRFGGGNVN